MQEKSTNRWMLSTVVLALVATFMLGYLLQESPQAKAQSGIIPARRGPHYQYMLCQFPGFDVAVVRIDISQPNPIPETYDLRSLKSGDHDHHYWKQAPYRPEEK